MRLLDLDDRYSLVQYINEDCVKSYKMKTHMERIDEQFFKPWSRYLEEQQLTADQINQIFQAAHKEAQASGTNSTMLGKIVEKIIPDSMLQKLSDSLPEPDPNAANDPQFANKAGAAVNQLPVDAESKAGLMKIVANAAKNPAVQPIVLSLVGGVLGGLVQKVGPSLNAMGLPGTLVAGVAGAVVAGGVAVAAAKIQGKSWKDAFKGAVKPALAGAAGAVLGKMAADFVGGIGSGGGGSAKAAGGDTAAMDQAISSDQQKMDALTNKYPPDEGYQYQSDGGDRIRVVDANGNSVFTGDIKPQSMDAKTFADLANQGQPVQQQTTVNTGAQNTAGDLSGMAGGDEWASDPNVKMATYVHPDNGMRVQASADGGSPFQPGTPNYQARQQLRTQMATQSREYLGNKLSEGQCYLILKRVAATNRDMIIEGYLILEAPGMLQKAGTWLKTKAQNITQQVTADKLMQAWKAAKQPMDSNGVAKVMADAGVNADVIKKVYTDMKLPEPGAEGTADQVDYKTLSAEIMKLPVDSKVQIVNYMKNELKVA